MNHQSLSLIWLLFCAIDAIDCSMMLIEEHQTSRALTVMKNFFLDYLLQKRLRHKWTKIVLIKLFIKSPINNTNWHITRKNTKTAYLGRNVHLGRSYSSRNISGENFTSSKTKNK